MNRERALQVANAVLYEGYMLYPYRPSAVKNRQRWSFGILYPPAYHEVGAGTERSAMHSECLVKAAAMRPTLSPENGQKDGALTIHVQLRFLQLVQTQSGEAGCERSFDYETRMADDVERKFSFAVPASAPPGRHEHLTGSILIATAKLSDDAIRLTIDVANASSIDSDPRDRDAALRASLVSAHIILSLTGGEFVSLLDPPVELRQAAAQCKNIGNFPVLVGDEGQRDMMLCSPIILYDYPQVAPESAGDFFDGTEMDEMLTLRVMTLSDDEKNAMRAGDDRIRELLERTEASARGQLMRTHGTIRDMRPAPRVEPIIDLWNPEAPQNTPLDSVTAFGIELKRGDRVRLWPQKSADILDMAMKGKVATVEAIERDYDDQVHLAVVLEDDPGRDLGMLRQPGHRFFFSPEEVEPLALNNEVKHER
jgi:hypothetical protein